MKKETRTTNSIKNTLFGVCGQILCMLLSFISRTVFIQVLSVDYLGISGLFQNLISLLSITELGISTAIIYSMYEPLAKEDEEKIRALMNMYKKVYKVIGILVAVIGVFIIPFLNIIAKDISIQDNIILIYFIFLTNSVVSYFFSHKKSIIIADQKNYIVLFNQYLFQITRIISQLVFLILTKKYIIYIMIDLIFSLLENIFISIKADKLYPYLKKKNTVKLEHKTKVEIIKNTKAMLFHKIGDVMIRGTDNILISCFIGVYWVGLYSNYLIILSAVKAIIYQIFVALTASIGNLKVLEKNTKQKSVFNKLFFMSFIIYGNSSILLMLLFNPFINVWIGEKFAMDNHIVLLIVISFYLSGIKSIVVSFKEAYGLFWNDRYKSIVESIINLVVSIILLKIIGIAGVFLGTIISTLLTSFWIEPYIVYKYGLKAELREYFQKYSIYLLATIFTYIITNKLTVFIDITNFGGVILKAISIVIITNLLFMMIFFRTDEFKYYISLLRKIIKGYKNNKDDEVNAY